MRFRFWNLSARDNVNLYLFIGVLFVVGAVFGGLLVRALTFEQQQDLAETLGLYMQNVGGGTGLHPAAVFWDGFVFYAKWILLIWLLGMSVIGVPLVLVLDFLKGVLVGFTAGLLVHEFAWKGLLFFLATVAPPNALAVPALMIASASAARFAYFIVRERLFRRKGRMMPPFLAHTAVAALMLIMVGLASIYEAYVSPLLLERVTPHTTPASHSSAAVRL
ncbi:stage II sporulation protein M [Cohnella pontilimi]|uniref:Stage II sporulation protein M n=1 Tax=Cohnella pontilimi TaxID=2564100 RepID=A0A4U0FIW7_9BACL|nr:stage II sporulation protein M [Cohnella pontilimi]TJY44414.1 stage II sporulation protein M [Cohnella pontilimi]